MDTFNQKNYSVTWIPKNLELNKNIFLSHSGCDKPFVEKLYTALLRKTYDAFFDKKSLPKAVVINMENILKEVGKSKLCVFVLSEAFFTETKNPMLEFMSFLDAHRNDSSKRLLPLFYNLSVKEFKNEERHGKWMKKWEEWAQEGSMAFDINPERWKGALKNLSDTSGIEMTKGSKEEQYIEEIICEICKIIPPDSRYDEPCMHGEQRMGKVVDDLYLEHEKCAKHEPSKVCLLGMHGMGGLGKTTLSKFAWNYFWSEFEGRVFRVELDSGSKDSRFQRMRSVLEKLSNIPKEILASLNDVDEARKWYRRHIGERRVFLIIDNANSECMEEIRMYLQGVRFHQGSRVLILSRSKTNLQDIGMEVKDVYPNFHIVKMVSLRKEEAEDIFLSRAQVCREQLSRREYDIVRDSVELCLFEGFYHPMVVQALASRIKQDNWDAQFLSKYRTGVLRKTVIKLLKESFDAMETQTKIILLDLALYLPSTDLKCDPYEWLSSVNEIEQSEVKNELAELRRRAFLSEEGLAVHELVKELAILASNDNTIKSCVYFDKTKQPWARLEDADAVHVERLGMDSCEAKIPTLNLQKCPWLRAVKIKDVTGLRKVQMRQNMVSLRSFEVSSSEFMEGFRGDWNRMSKKPCIRSIVIEGNRNFGSLNWVSTENCRLVKPVGRKELRSGQFGSLVCLRMLVGLEQISIPWQALQNTLNSLKELELGGFDGGEIIKLPEFRQLRNLHLTKCLSTRELHFVSLPMVENLRIHWAPNLTFIGGLERCSSSLKHLDLFGCTSLQSKFLDLSSLSLLSDLKIWYCKSLVRLKGLEKLQSLKSLTLNYCSGLVSLLQDGSFYVLPNLEVVSILGCSNLSNINNLFSIRHFEYSESNGYLKDVMDFWDELLGRDEFFSIRGFGAWQLPTHKIEFMESVIKNSQTLPVAPVNELFSLEPVFKFLESKYVKRNNRSSCGFLKMLTVSICQSSKEEQEDLTDQLLHNMSIMSQFLSSVQPITLLVCLAYLRCDSTLVNQINLNIAANDFYFDMLLQMAGGLDAIFESWVRHHSYSDPTNNIRYASKMEHGLILLVVTGFLSSENCPNLATQIATIYSTVLFDIKTILESYLLSHLPLIAIDALTRLLNDKNIQRKIQEMNGRVDNIEVLNRRLKCLKRENLNIHRNNLLTEIFEDFNTGPSEVTLT